MESIVIEQKAKDPFLNLIIDTLDRQKQALVFVNTKKSAEKQAEDIARYLKRGTPDLDLLAKQILGILAQPTQQCARLAGCVRAGTAFHHSGLHTKQREIIEDNFRSGKIKIICATPTLAAGVDLPAFRSIVKDLKRFDGNYGMVPIPILEYQQMIGRAGRPSFDNLGEGICVAKSDAEAEEIHRRYILGAPEEIYSKLAAEPALRMYLLSLIAGRFVSSREQILGFFRKTFWAYQYHDMAELESIISTQLERLEEWTFIARRGGADATDFVGGDELISESYTATPLGTRVAELYLDPFTAHEFCEALSLATKATLTSWSFVHLICTALEMRPLLHVRTKEWDTISEASVSHLASLLVPEPSLYDPDYEDFLDAVKTTLMLHDWMDEKTEQELLEAYDIRPGETRNKLDNGDWLLRCLIELGRVLDIERRVLAEINKTRIRLKHGIKEELVPLVKFRGIGRVRARKLFANGVRNIADISRTEMITLARLVGVKTATSLKEQVGQKEAEPVGPLKRKGQMGLGKYSD
ncbi:hypothetical protein HY641_04480 [Candidatus Woesearchaeota archaeon]|nr:hypothetical protein [Candidatus Woesearchaeota archaeon]